MKLSTRDRVNINRMIRTETVYGLPLSEVTQEIFEAFDEEEIKTLYIVTSMLQWKCFDDITSEHFPEDANQYLKKFTLKSN